LLRQRRRHVSDRTFETGSPLGQHPAGWPVVHLGAAHALATRCRQQAGQLASIGGWRPRVWRLEQPIVGLRASMFVVWNIIVRVCIHNRYAVRTLVMYKIGNCSDVLHGVIHIVTCMPSAQSRSCWRLDRPIVGLRASVWHFDQAVDARDRLKCYTCTRRAIGGQCVSSNEEIQS
jgi:hypothetical protein